MKKAILIFMLLPALAMSATYYVSLGGDNSDGTTWAKAWTTIDSSNANVGAGDTCYFGSGIFRGQLQPVGGTFGDRTAYICSSSVFGCAEIRNSDSLTGWEVYSGNVYYVVHNPVRDSLLNHFLLAQGDSIIMERTSYAAVDAEGEWFRGTGDTIFVYVWDLGSGYDPDSYDMEWAYNTLVDFDAADEYVTIRGINFKYGAPWGIDFGGAESESTSPDSVIIEHCKISHISGVAATNASCIYYSSAGSGAASYAEIRACSLGYVQQKNMSDKTDNLGTSGHSSAMTAYSFEYSVIESCTVFGYLGGAGLQLKAGTDEHDIVMRYNTISPTQCRGAIEIKNVPTTGDSIYGNILDGGNTGGSSSNFYAGLLIYGGTADNDTIEIFNNTFYNTNTPVNYYNEFGPQRIPSNFKYNVIYEDNSTYEGFWYFYLASDTSLIFPDSNMYYGLDTCFEISGCNTWAQWQSYGKDTNSVIGTDPGFTDGDGGDFTRAGASGEMNLTYGGQTWTIYGAVQNEAEESSRMYLWLRR